MAIGSPDAPTRTIVRTATAIGAGGSTISSRKKHEDSFVDSFDDFPRKWVIGITGISCIPCFLKDTPAIGENLGCPITTVLVDRPLEGLQCSADGAGRRATA
jgi:hypothetical protein